MVRAEDGLMIREKDGALTTPMIWILASSEQRYQLMAEMPVNDGEWQLNMLAMAGVGEAKQSGGRRN
jgi:hypothetical protein